MIDLYAYNTVNSLKIIIMLEEAALPYRVHVINTRKGAQRTAEFLAINPNGKVPVIVDHSAPGGMLTLSESGAILHYLAEKSGFGLPAETAKRALTMEWLAYQLSTQGPLFGQCEYWVRLAPEPDTATTAHYLAIGRKILGQMNKHLAKSSFFGGEDYGIADIAHFAWMTRANGISLPFTTHPAVSRWYDAINTRPKVASAIERAEKLQ